MTTDTGYTLIYSVVHGNVVGAVIAPKGTEHYPKDQRMLVWRAMIKPLVEEVVQHEAFPVEDIRKVHEALFEFCVNEGLAIRVQQESDQED